ncbi:hypothetical protein ACP70R_026946 [Stipagrostis hirtigluma subsp. patula]
MKIAVHSSKAVKPAYCGGNGGTSTGPTATADAVPLSVFDKATFNTHISVIYGFRPPAPSNAVLEAGLAKVLVEYREWVGRFGVDAAGNRDILLTDEGARFVEATADVTLDSVMPLKPTPEVLALHPSRHDAPELMLIQVTRFACGSLVVGFTTHHAVADGRVTSNFFVAWSQATRGVAVDLTPVSRSIHLFLTSEAMESSLPTKVPICQASGKNILAPEDQAAQLEVFQNSNEDS